MSHMVRVYRVLGDSLSCWFSPQGSLATALLSVEGQPVPVAGQLPGLRAGGALAYLEWLGYRPAWDRAAIQVAGELAGHVAPLGLTVEAVWCQPGRLNASLIRSQDRRLACPRRMVLLCYRSAEGLRLLDVAESALANAIVQTLTRTPTS